MSCGLLSTYICIPRGLWGYLKGLWRFTYLHSRHCSPNLLFIPCVMVVVAKGKCQGITQMHSQAHIIFVTVSVFTSFVVVLSIFPRKRKRFTTFSLTILWTRPKIHTFKQHTAWVYSQLVWGEITKLGTGIHWADPANMLCRSVLVPKLLMI